MAKKLQITKKSNLKGDDGYKIFSIRVKEDIVEKLDEISVQTNRSRNELINLLLEFAVENSEIVE
ncbi:MAG: ribbon-helix-helix domain-containing protein [Ruminococcus sp.]|nr:ribbon-helix-helix domain-containing protein [Ruminococcus sp.]